MMPSNESYLFWFEDRRGFVALDDFVDFILTLLAEHHFSSLSTISTMKYEYVTLSTSIL